MGIPLIKSEVQNVKKCMKEIIKFELTHEKEGVSNDAPSSIHPA